MKPATTITTDNEGRQEQDGKERLNAAACFLHKKSLAGKLKHVSFAKVQVSSKLQDSTADFRRECLQLSNESSVPSQWWPNGDCQQQPQVAEVGLILSVQARSRDHVAIHHKAQIDAPRASSLGPENQQSNVQADKSPGRAICLCCSGTSPASQHESKCNEGEREELVVLLAPQHVKLP